jgi:hypothetical protein
MHLGCCILVIAYMYLDLVIQARLYPILASPIYVPLVSQCLPQILTRNPSEYNTMRTIVSVLA